MSTVLISGAGIAGPSLAYWLGRGGHDVTVVEEAAGVRASGSAVDFRGDQLALLTRMGVLDEIRAHETGMGDQLIVDAAGRRRATFPAALFSGEVEIERGDLARILYDHSRAYADYVFDDRITALAEDGDGVDVTFARGPARRFDLVVGADGLHSAVRKLAFGGTKTNPGYYGASFTMPNTFGLDHAGLVYNEPGRMVSVGSARDAARASVSMFFAASDVDYPRGDLAAQREIVRRRFAGAAWRTPEILAALGEAADLYLSPLTQVHLDRWSTGRIALLGDAAWCAGPGGNGTGHAMLGAYLLAGELATGDHRAAFARYEELMRPAAAKSQKFAAGAGRFLAPPTQRKINSRNRMYRLLSTRLMSGVFTRLSTKNADTGALPDYPLPVH